MAPSMYSCGQAYEGPTYFRRLSTVEVMLATRLIGRRMLHVEFNASLFRTIPYVLRGWR